MLIDSHCHLQDEQFDRDRAEVMNRAREAGVQAFVVIGTDLRSSEQAVELASRQPDVYATVGVHPHDATTLDDATLSRLRDLAARPKVVAIGEIGLDFYRNLSPPEDQRRAFREQLELAAELGLPVSIHSRDSEEETFAVLSERQSRITGWPSSRPAGVMHCFSGDIPLAMRYTEMGFLVSIPGTCTYPKAERTRSVAATLPLGWLAVETDAPYLAPQPHRGRRNEPAFLRDTVQYIAQLRDEAFETVAAAASLSVTRLFAMGGAKEETLSRQGEN